METDDSNSTSNPDSKGVENQELKKKSPMSVEQASLSAEVSPMATSRGDWSLYSQATYSVQHRIPPNGVPLPHPSSQLGPHSSGGSCPVSCPLYVLKVEEEEAKASEQIATIREKELKHEKRKQSNRESAKRSRVRKKEECGRLKKEAESLIKKGTELMDQLQHYSKGSMDLMRGNKLNLEKLEQVYGPKSVADIRAKFDDLTKGESIHS